MTVLQATDISKPFPPTHRLLVLAVDYANVLLAGKRVCKPLHAPLTWGDPSSEALDVLGGSNKTGKNKSPRMDWFHCNWCFTKRGSKFAVSSCGHIYCEACIKSKQCSICRTSCSYLPITDEMKPQEKVYFKDPVKLIQSLLEHISQIALFQARQVEMVIVHFKHKATELERHLKEVTEQGYRDLSELKRENADLKMQLLEVKRENVQLKKPLSQRRVSPGSFQKDGCLRMSLPVAVTSPVTSLSRCASHLGSSESQVWARDRGPGLYSFTTPGSAASVSSHSSLHEHVHRTPTSFSTTARMQHRTPVFHFQSTSGLSIQSPRL